MIRGSEILIESSDDDRTQIARTIRVPVSEADVAVLTGDLVRIWYPDRNSVTFEWMDVRNMGDTDGHPHERSEHRVLTQVTVSNTGPLLRLAAEDAVVGALPLGSFHVAWEFLAGPKDGSRPDFLWTPSLCPNEGQVIGQHFYRSPAVIVQHGNVSCALTPDLDLIAENQPVQSYMNLECPRDTPGPPRMIAGVGAYRVDGHVYHTTEGVAPVKIENTVVRFGCELHVDRRTPERRAHQAIVRHYWETYGHKWLQDIRPQTVPFSKYCDYGYNYADDTLWRETSIDGKRIGAMLSEREYGNDVWFQGWFNQLRTAYGMYSWARRTGDDERVSKAAATRELVFAAPMDRGLFPTIAIFPESDGSGAIEWVASTLQGGGPDIYSLQDCSWTACWLLRWHNDLAPDERSLPFCRDYADALLRLQREDGG